MATGQDFEKLFKDDAFVSKYKIGEKITGEFAKVLIEQSGIANSTQRPLVIFDNACGTGIISSTLHDTLSVSARETWKLTCGDISEGMLEYTKQRIEHEHWHNAETKIVDAQNTGLPSTHYTHVFAAFVFTTVPNYQAALDESFRILQPGGTIAISTWEKPGWIPIVKSAVETMPGNLPFPTTEEFLKTNTGQWNSGSWVESQLRKGGFENVQITAVSRSVRFDIHEFVSMAMAILPMLLQKFWTQEQRDQSEANVQPTLLRYLEEKYGPHGQVPAEFVAVIATGHKP
ncbi:hypothetical protein AWENTII_005746 [Aspergillus wentii]|nr:hypothetical protein MW887_000348 [Aspergillus wentii]